jgi:hypothetical protein
VVTCTATDAAGNSASASFTVTVHGAGEQIAALIEKTLAYLELPLLRPAFRAWLSAGAEALAAERPAVTCLVLRVYIAAVDAAPRRAFSAAEKADLIADAVRIRAVIGCR